MKYKKRYNFIICFMLLVIVFCATFFFCGQKPNNVESEKNLETIEIEKKQEQEIENLPKNKATFNNFSTALRHAYSFLNTTAGYKSYTFGKFSLNIKNLVNIEQTIKLTAEINNKNNSSHTTVCTYGVGKIKNNTGFEFAKIGDEITMKQSHDMRNNEFDYTQKQVKTYSLQEYLGEWNILPEHAFTKFSTSKVVGGNMTKSTNRYVLNFTLETGEIIDDSFIFVKRFFDNSANSQQINPSFTNINVELTLDEYGRPLKAKYQTNFYDLSLYGVGIPLSGLTGAVTYTQQFYGFGQNINISKLQTN